MSEYVIHEQDCQCADCINWFAAMVTRPNRGRCGCGFPVDEHQMAKDGSIQRCPQKVAA